MTAKEMAQMLNGCQYGNELTKDDERLAKESGLVVVFGYSDDNMEFRGAINDEVECYDGGIAYLSGNEIIKKPDCGPMSCKYFDIVKKNAKIIESVWCDKEIDAAWSYRTDIPHETFNVYEDDELYCIGIVFRLEDLK